MRTRSVLVALVTAAAVAAGTAFLAPASRAQEVETVTAYVGGVDSRPRTASEIVLSNLTSSTYTLDLVLRDTNGTEIINRPGEIQLAARQTKTVDLLEQLRRGLTRTQKHYMGIFTVEVRGAAPFGGDTVLLHVTQYYGTRKLPRAAFVQQPLYQSTAAPL